MSVLKFIVFCGISFGFVYGYHYNPSPPKKLPPIPLRIYKDDYETILQCNNCIILHNLPSGIIRFTLHYGDGIGISNTYEKPIDWISIEPTKLRKGFERMYITICATSKDDRCQTSLIIEIEQHPSRRQQAPAADKCCENPSCTIHLSWDYNRLDVQASKLMSKESKRARKNVKKNKKKEKFKTKFKDERIKAREIIISRNKRSHWCLTGLWFHCEDFIVVTTTPRPPPPKTPRKPPPPTPRKPPPTTMAVAPTTKRPSLPHNMYYTEGNEVTLHCESDVSTAKIAWRQEKIGAEHIDVGKIPFSYVKQYKLSFWAETFDSYTSLKCVVNYHQGATEPKIETYLINVTPKDSSAANTQIAVMNYSETLPVDFNCTSYVRPSSYVYVLHYNSNESEIFATTSLNKSFNEEDNGTILCCIYYRDMKVIDNDREIQRYVENKTMLLYQVSRFEPEHLIIDGTEYYFIGAAVIIVIIIIIIILLIVRNLHKRKITIAPKHKEVTNECVNPTLYAELDLVTQPGGRRPDPEDTTYAQITNPNTVLYAQLDLQERNQSRPHIEESPYAQIANFNNCGLKK